ncbi:MAG: hypothetical protein ABIV51_12675 [Saprospiraceae bacterium]
MMISCGQEPPLPKPRSYPKVVYPPKVYRPFTETYCPFTFQYPNYAEVQKDTSYFGKKPVNDCWFDLYIPNFDCRLYCTYYPIGTTKDLDQLVADAFKLGREHSSRANYIDEIPYHKSAKLNGMIFDYDGPAATPFQFYLTDSTQHFFKAALYFNTQVRPDSLKPVTEFVKKDLIHLMNTFGWK